MPPILLDTSAYSAFLRGHKEIFSELQRADRICVSPVILGELFAGFRKGSRRKKNEAELGSFLNSARVEVLPVDQETAVRYAVILESLWQAGTPLPTNDLWIAASAMQHGLTLLTTDRHYQFVKQIVVQLFESS